MTEQFKIPAGGLLDPAQMRAKQIEKEAQERIDKIVAKIVKILVEEGVLINELEKIKEYLSAKIYNSASKKSIEEVLKC